MNVTGEMLPDGGNISHPTRALLPALEGAFSIGQAYRFDDPTLIRRNPACRLGKQVKLAAARKRTHVIGSLPAFLKARGASYELIAVDVNPLVSPKVHAESPQANVEIVGDVQGVLGRARGSLRRTQTLKTEGDQEISLSPFNVLSPKPALLTQQLLPPPLDPAGEMVVCRHCPGGFDSSQAFASR